MSRRREITVARTVRLGPLEIHNPALQSPVPPPPDHPCWRRRPPLGLGDLVEVFAKPIARALDAADAWLLRGLRRRQRLALKRWGIKPSRRAGCMACTLRKAWLNGLVPNVSRPGCWVRLVWRVLCKGHARVMPRSGKAGR